MSFSTEHKCEEKSAEGGQKTSAMGRHERTDQSPPFFFFLTFQHSPDLVIEGQPLADTLVSDGALCGPGLAPYRISLLLRLFVHLRLLVGQTQGCTRGEGSESMVWRGIT